MSVVRSFTFNPYFENTLVVYDNTNECVIFDPGCHSTAEQDTLREYISTEQLKPVHLVNTHGHIDHMLGNRFVADLYNLPLQIHRDEVPVLESAELVGKALGIDVVPSPAPGSFLEDGDVLEFGNTKMEIILAPGHSPASLCFYDRSSKLDDDVEVYPGHGEKTTIGFERQNNPFLLERM